MKRKCTNCKGPIPEWNEGPDHADAKQCIHFLQWQLARTMAFVELMVQTGMKDWKPQANFSVYDADYQPPA